MTRYVTCTTKFTKYLADQNVLAMLLLVSGRGRNVNWMTPDNIEAVFRGD